MLELIALDAISDRDTFFAEAGQQVEILFVNSSTRVPIEMVNQLSSLRLIAILGAGYDMVDVIHARSRKIAITTGRGVNRDDVADMAIGLLLATVRLIGSGDRLVRSGGWERPLPLPQARSLCDLNYGVIGMGSIGSTIANRLSIFGRPIRWWGPRPKDVPWERAGSLVGLAEASDVLIVACRADASTKHLVTAAVLQALGNRGFLINISRGNVIDEAALIESLRHRTIAGAGLDVFAEEPTNPALWAELDQVVLMPHVGGWAERGMRLAEEALVENVRRYLGKEPLLTPLEI